MDFQFSPEEGSLPPPGGEIGANPSQLPHVVHLNPLLESENKTGLPLLPGGGGPAPAQPTLHVGAAEPTVSGMKGKTAEGGTVLYSYKPNGDPYVADVYGPDDKWKETHWADVSDVNFPAAPSAKPTLPEPKQDVQQGLSIYPRFSPKEPLTKSEEELVRDYTRNLYSHLANHIYGEHSSNEAAAKIDRLNDVIAKHLLTEPATLYRGVSSGVFDHFSHLQPGQSGIHAGFMSTSSSKDFASGQREGGYHFVIEAPQGANALPLKHLSNYPHENEVLFGTGTRLKLVKKEVKALYFEVVP